MQNTDTKAIKNKYGEIPLFIQNVGLDRSGKWTKRIALYECPNCKAQFKANVADIKRMRVRHCGCINYQLAKNRPLPKEINGITIIKDLGVNSQSRRMAEFQCPHCPGTFSAVISEIKRGVSKKHCGCYKKPKVIKVCVRKEKKPINRPKLKIGHHLYSIWKHMKNKKHIYFYPEWKDFSKFCEDVGNKKDEGFILVRIDSSKGYIPSNMKWGYRSDIDRKRNSHERKIAIKRIRRMVSEAFKRKDYTKGSSTSRIIGCDYDHLIKHIENQFKEGMAWDNRGLWHIDHIKPIASAKTIEDMYKLNHYTNLQPLWAKENILKGSKCAYNEVASI